MSGDEAAVGDLGFWRGHRMRYEGGDTWVYVDTGEPVSDDPDRACGHCRKANTPEGHDGCIGTLVGVMAACCGHGASRDAYVLYNDGHRIEGAAALAAVRAGRPPAATDTEGSWRRRCPVCRAPGYTSRGCSSGRCPDGRGTV